MELNGILFDSRSEWLAARILACRQQTTSSTSDTTGPDEAVTYILSLIYASTAGLIEKRKKIGEFDLARFQSKYRDECSRLGYNLVVDIPEPNTVAAE
jgi:hypothetical protein